MKRGMHTSVVITRHDALGLRVTSPVMSPTSPNSASISRNFWLLRACSVQLAFLYKAKHYKFAHLYRTCVNYPLLVRQRLRYCIFRNHSFSSRRVRTDEYTLIALNCIHTELLEGVECKFVLARGFRGWDMSLNGDIVVAVGDCYLVPNLKLTSLYELPYVPSTE